MSRVFLGLVVAGLCVFLAKPSFAIKGISDVFVATYASNGATPEFRKLVVEEAKCNVCHIDKENKKMRNPYGAAVHDALEDANFPMADFKKALKDEKYVSMIKEILKKLEEKKPKDAAADAKTFGARIKEGLLPGGDRYGK